MNPWMLSNSRIIDQIFLDEFENLTQIKLPDQHDPSFLNLLFFFLSSKKWDWFLSKQKENFLMTITVDDQESCVIHTEKNAAIFLCILDALCCENYQ